MDETYFEHLESFELSGRGSEGLGGVGSESYYFEEVDDDLEDDDWWEELGRQLRSRQRGFQYQSRKTKQVPEESQQQSGAPQEGDRFAWEHGIPPGPNNPRSFVYAGGGRAHTGSDELTEEKRAERFD